MAPTTAIPIRLAVTRQKCSGDNDIISFVIEPREAQLMGKSLAELKMVYHPDHLFECFVVMLLLVDRDAIGIPVLLRRPRRLLITLASTKVILPSFLVLHSSGLEEGIQEIVSDLL